MDTLRLRRTDHAGLLGRPARIWSLSSAAGRPAASRPLPTPPSAPGSGPWLHTPLAGPHRQAEVRRRARGDAFGPVPDDLRLSVALAVCGQPEVLPALVAALAAQRDAAGSPFERGEAEALVALVGDEADVGAALAAQYPWLRTTVVRGLPAGAGPEWTCQVAMDAACVRLLAAGRPEGLVLTTARPQLPDWMARADAAATRGADAWADALPDLDAGLAITARAYAHVGGLPLRCPSPASALTDTLRAAGARFFDSSVARRDETFRDEALRVSTALTS